MGKLIILNNSGGVSVILDREEIRESGTYNGEILQVHVPARMTAKENKKAFKLADDGVYLLLTTAWNARDSFNIVDTFQASKVWIYGDSHGMKGAALFVIEHEKFTIDYNVPGHHGHSIEKYRLFGNINGEIKIEIRLDQKDITVLKSGFKKTSYNKKIYDTTRECDFRNRFNMYFNRTNPPNVPYDLNGETYGDNFIVPIPRPVIEEFTFPLDLDLFQVADEIARKHLPDMPTWARIEHHGNSQNEGLVEYYYGDMDFAEYTVRVYRDGDKLVAERT